MSERVCVCELLALPAANVSTASNLVSLSLNTLVPITLPLIVMPLKALTLVPKSFFLRYELRLAVNVTVSFCIEPALLVPSNESI